MNSRLYNCLKVFRIIRRVAEERGIKKLLINGDLIEENAYIEVGVYDAVFQEIEKCSKAGLETVINVGNHDILRQSGGRTLHSLRPFSSISRVVEEPELVWDRLQVVPWNASPNALKKTIRKLEGNRRYGLVLHCGVQGARTGPTSYLVRNPIHLRDIRPRDFGVVLLSDYHTYQRLRSNVFYLGSPLQHTFGETHKPCIWDIQLLDHSPYFSAHKIFTNLPQFKRTEIHPGKGIETLKSRISDLQSNYVRVELWEDADVSERAIEKYARGRFQVQIVHRTATGSDGSSDVQTLEAEEAIRKYASSNSKKRDFKRLVKLGNEIYRGEL